jgi:uncharacterized membrane protein YdjX (TVP38/TMEM64 family)
MMGRPQQGVDMPGTRKRAIAWGAATLIFCAGALAAQQPGTVPDALAGLHTLLAAAPLLAPLLFIGAYALAVVLLLPGTLFCLLGGALFGVWLGILFNILGASLGALLAFLISRHLASGMVERHLGNRMQQLKQGVEREGWRFVALVRLIPMVPYDLSNYAFGLSRIPLLQFAAANALCLLPRLAVYTYIGHSGMTLISEEGDRLVDLVGMATLLIAVLLLPYIYGRIKRPLN